MQNYATMSGKTEYGTVFLMLCSYYKCCVTIQHLDKDLCINCHAVNNNKCCH